MRVKIQVFCPKDSAERVRRAVAQAGAGRIGLYDSCAFESAGQGFFRPLEDAQPSRGEIGKIERVEEVKVEFVCDRDSAPAIIAAMKSAHPYEEVAYDVFPLLDL